MRHMSELPASVRLALWVTRAWSGRGTLSEAVDRALPDVDHVDGLMEPLRLWRDLGEAALLVALPHPGDLGMLPRCGPVAADLAVEAGEAVFVPGVGGMLVPATSSFGSAGAEGLRIDWSSHDAGPVAVHRVEQLDPRDLERRLRVLLAEATTDLERIGGVPFLGTLRAELTDTRLGGRWALPPDLAAASTRLITSAATVGNAARAALTGPSGSLDAGSATAREGVLRRLARESDLVLAEATDVACALTAGWLPNR